MEMWVKLKGNSSNLFTGQGAPRHMWKTSYKTFCGSSGRSTKSDKIPHVLSHTNLRSNCLQLGCIVGNVGTKFWKNWWNEKRIYLAPLHQFQACWVLFLPIESLAMLCNAKSLGYILSNIGKEWILMQDPWNTNWVSPLVQLKGNSIRIGLWFDQLAPFSSESKMKICLLISTVSGL